MNHKTAVKDKESENKKIRSFLVSLLFSFIVVFYPSAEMYLSNIDSLLISSKYILVPTSILSLIICTCLYFLLMRISSKAYDNLICLLFGLSIAVYVQENFLQIAANQLDGSRQVLSIFQVFGNILIWIICIIFPYLIRKLLADLAEKIIYIVSISLLIMEAAALIFLCYQITVLDDTIILTNCLMNKVSPYAFSYENMYEYSADHNFIVILTDEYDSFAFDKAVEEYPETKDDFKDFTYYKDTLGAYQYSADSFPYIFAGKLKEDPSYNTKFFETLKSRGYRIEMYTVLDTFPQNVFLDYVDNYSAYSYTLQDVFELNMLIHKLAAYKLSPLVLKPLFFVSSTEVDKVVSVGQDITKRQNYSQDNLDFYNSIPSEITANDPEKMFKFIYLNGLHVSRDITRDLERISTYEQLLPEEEAIAVNKILAKYISRLKESDIFDNSDIIILADHGVKEIDYGKYPLLLIKRAGEHHDTMNISDVNVSYADVYPTLLYLAGSDENVRTVFDLTEEDNEVRYFATTDEYITGDIK